MLLDLFLLPFLTGLALAILLPVLGCYLRLRDEWLAALAYTHVAAAGSLLAGIAAWPPLAGGLLAASAAGAGKRLFGGRLAGGTAYAMLLLAGWAATILLSANYPAVEHLGHALFDGQLYFASAEQLLIVAIGVPVVLAALRFLSRDLQLAQLYPDFFRVRGMLAWPTQIGFDLLAALALALATASLGVMGAFALVFIPPWLGFRRAGSWRKGLGLALSFGVAGYVGAFALALWLDQPFGPVLALLLVLAGLLAG